MIKFRARADVAVLARHTKLNLRDERVANL
jgi:hypothetical protein